MDLALFTRNRLKQLKLSPRHLARATRMTESYIAHLRASDRPPKACTGMQDQLERVLRLPQGQLAKIADLQRHEYLETRGHQPGALLHRRAGPYGVLWT